MRRFYDTVEVVGFAAVAAGVTLLSVPAGVIVGGVLAVVWANLRAQQ